MQRFTPDTRKARRDALLTACASFLVAPVYFWWSGFSRVLAGALVTLFAFVVLGVRGAWMLYVRGLDTIAIDDGGVQLARRKASASFRWAELHRVYRFGEMLVFESHAHDRYYLSLIGHEDRAKELVGVLVLYANTLDLRWVDELA